MTHAFEIKSENIWEEIYCFWSTLSFVLARRADEERMKQIWMNYVLKGQEVSTSGKQNPGTSN